MSGAELIAVIGVAASTAQIIDYSLKVIAMIPEIYSRVKDARKRISHYTTQINQIIAACRAIRDSKDLETPLLNDQLRSTFNELERLNKVLVGIVQDYTVGSKGRRVWKTIVGNEERLIVTGFERLEKEKTSLIICINILQTQLLQNIGSGVEILIESGMGPGFAGKMMEKLKGKKKSSKIQDPTLVPGTSGAEIVLSTSASSMSRDLVKSDRRNGMSSLDQPREGMSSQQQQEKTKKKKKKTTKETKATKDTKPTKGQRFEKMKASKNATQYNGDINLTASSSHSYDGSTSHGNSNQFNGNRGCAGGSGAHKHKHGHASGRSIQHNGNVGSGVMDKDIRKMAGKQHEFEREESEEESEAEELGEESDESSDEDAEEASDEEGNAGEVYKSKALTQR